MRLLHGGCLLAIAVAVLILPSLAPAAVRIELKNGRTIIADECRESDGTLECYKMGGTFVIEKRDIASIKKTSASESLDENETAPSAQPEVKEGAAKTEKSAEPGNPGAEARKRLDWITGRKRALQPEREKLVKEREHLQEEQKNAPYWMTVYQFNDLKQKISSLDERIKAFNDEAKKLNEEEKTILDSQKDKGPQTP
jgi:hypothetical protein